MEAIWIDKLYEGYSRLNIKLSSYYGSIAEAKNSNGFLKLERMKLPVFKGNIRDYARFKTDFTTYVMPQINSTDSAAYTLKSCLSSERDKGLVQNVDDDIDQMWKCLDEKYGDPSKLIDMVLNDVRKIKFINAGEDKKFIDLVDIIERGYRDLSLLGIEKEISNTGTVSLVEERIPKDIRREWSRRVNKEDSDVNLYDKFPYFIRFLREQKRIIEYESSEIRGNSSLRGNRSSAFLLQGE